MLEGASAATCDVLREETCVGEKADTWALVMDATWLGVTASI